MLDDLLELTTTLVHPEHEPSIAGTSSSANASGNTMPPRNRHSKTASVSSTTGGSTTVDANGGIVPATGPKSGSPATARKPRSRSTTSPPGSPIVAVARRAEPVKTVGSKNGIQPVKFTLAVLSSIVLEAGLQTAASLVGTGDLAAVSKQPDTWVEISSLLGWKVAKLGLFWFSDFDAYDVASVSLLLTTPPTILLGLFYEISPLTLTSTTFCSIVANSVPYFFLRPLSPSHAPGSAPKSSVRNRPILTDPYTTIATSLLATAIFAVLLEASFASFLPQWLITHFTGLRSLDAAHLGASGLPTLLLALVPAGIACMEFLFAPSTAAPLPATPLVFDPATATFMEHVYYNAWGWYTARQKALIVRTTLLTYLMLTETVVQLWGTIAGVELTGALGYAGIWALGTAVLGSVLDWVGGPSD